MERYGKQFNLAIPQLHFNNNMDHGILKFKLSIVRNTEHGKTIFHEKSIMVGYARGYNF